MAKTTKKRRSVQRDPLIARAKKTLKPSKILKSKKRNKIARPSMAAQPLGAAITHVPPPLAVGSAALVLDRLWSVVVGRRSADPGRKRPPARLLARGTTKVAQKFGEEAVECLIEAVAGVIGGSSRRGKLDVLYHLIVLWVSVGVTPDEVWGELKRREGISGIAEKAARVKTLPVAVGHETTKIP